MTGTMTTTAKMLGVHGMQLEQGQKVQLTEPSNLPKEYRHNWFARPLNGKWSDGVDRNEEDSILIDADDVTLD